MGSLSSNGYENSGSTSIVVAVERVSRLEGDTEWPPEHASSLLEHLERGGRECYPAVSDEAASVFVPA
ncbi:MULTISPECIES: hypothetical protein [unclassified Natrinema]|uniref:hypothetical protein n=1 Tax=unclassified Natrinema TaxID=2622230 RepID=UPI00026D42D8|nr:MULTISPECIES: hypothetical protein [unclassified Natrinema]AFO55414.1 hypothetical protein NJ7G_0159 [Natrinema sp. J7-2]